MKKLYIEPQSTAYIIKPMSMIAATTPQVSRETLEDDPFIGARGTGGSDMWSSPTSEVETEDDTQSTGW